MLSGFTVVTTSQYTLQMQNHYTVHAKLTKCYVSVISPDENELQTYREHRLVSAPLTLGSSSPPFCLLAWASAPCWAAGLVMKAACCVSFFTIQLDLFKRGQHSRSEINPSALLPCWHGGGVRGSRVLGPCRPPASLAAFTSDLGRQ